MKGKLKFVLPLVLLLVLGGAYKTVLAKPAPKAKPKVDGQVYILPKEFLLNLKDGQYAKLTVALVLPEGEPTASTSKEAAAPPEGFGTLPQEAVVRSIVTDTVTGLPATRLTEVDGRESLKRTLLRRIDKLTDVKAEDVLLTDIAVQ